MAIAIAIGQELPQMLPRASSKVSTKQKGERHQSGLAKRNGISEKQSQVQGPPQMLTRASSMVSTMQKVKLPRRPPVKTNGNSKLPIEIGITSRMQTRATSKVCAMENIDRSRSAQAKRNDKTKVLIAIEQEPPRMLTRSKSSTIQKGEQHQSDLAKRNGMRKKPSQMEGPSQKIKPPRGAPAK